LSHLLREQAPITEAGWRLLDEEARERLTPALAARKLVDFSGPHGWEHSATNLGRVKDLDDAPGDDIAASQRRVLGLVDLRRRLEDGDVAAMRVAVEADRRPGDPHADRLPREGDRRAVDELVDEQPVADEEAGHHAPRRDAIRLDDEGANGEEDRDERNERLEGLPRPA